MPPQPTPDQLNPYAPPADAYVPPARPSVEPTEAGPFYAMSVQKLWIMSVLTFGIYDLWFWWRHWRHIRDNTGEHLSVFWRTVFSPFMYFNFHGRVKAEVEENQVEPPALLNAAPLLYLAANIAGRVLGRIEDDSLPVLLASVLIVPVSTACIASTQSAINSVLERQSYRGPVNDGVTAGAVVGGIFGALVWTLAVLGLFV